MDVCSLVVIWCVSWSSVQNNVSGLGLLSWCKMTTPGTLGLRCLFFARCELLDLNTILRSRFGFAVNMSVSIYGLLTSQISPYMGNAHVRGDAN